MSGYEKAKPISQASDKKVILGSITVNKEVADEAEEPTFGVTLTPVNPVGTPIKKQVPANGSVVFDSLPMGVYAKTRCLSTLPISLSVSVPQVLP